MPVDYNDPTYDYINYWNARDYENACEQIALNKLLPDKEKSIIDIGGGFGRLIPFYTHRFDQVCLYEPSSKLLNQAKIYLKDKVDITHISFINGSVYDLSKETKQKYNVVLMIRVSHHLEDLNKAIEEISKIIGSNGIFIFEFANKMHFKSVIKNIFSGNVKYFSTEPFSQAHKKITFLNFHPKYVEECLKRNGFKVEQRLSVSNFRSPLMKKILPFKMLVALEDILQKPLSYINFGPSIFVKCSRA